MLQTNQNHKEAWWPPVKLADIMVRPLAASDAELINAMHQRLSPTSIYDRYLQYRQPTLAEIAAVCQLPPAKGAGFVAVATAAPATIVGLAYYVREPEEAEPTAEPGILVEDRFQARGIGRSLWQQLQQHAQRDGLRWLRVLSHAQNERVACLVQGAGLPYVTKAHSGLREYLVGVEPQPTAAASKPMRSTLIGRWRQMGNRLSWYWQEQ